ncbi:hypothetical protein HX017_08115 [Myroides marinus]|nr:hypothetical protein [Myroides marinus]KUF43601.1 hypothetical protein AS361_13890 [Myroides marinus]MDM1347396.1 hypothetical protein [Myroides marinus]MDM1349783.1 hypothetical protein [Myroides marinus]MDM1353723.1 hypothetical protein [Myroides marinus]MDM1356992.1 hypothetical protein [Myroides marinus]
MNIRKEIMPLMKVAEERYPVILKVVLGYTDYCDEYGDEDNIEYKRVEQALHELTDKDMSNYDLWEYWEGESAEVFAFRIALPDPLPVKDVTEEELTFVVTKLKTFVEVDYTTKMTFEEEFDMYLDEYYYSFLKLNCSNYSPKLFNRNKNEKGEYFEYSIKEIVKHLTQGS